MKKQIVYWFETRVSSLNTNISKRVISFLYVKYHKGKNGRINLKKKSHLMSIPWKRGPWIFLAFRFVSNVRNFTHCFIASKPRFKECIIIVFLVD